MRLGRSVWIGISLAICALAQSTPDVGSGAPTPGITLNFVIAWQRNGFNRLVSTPKADVTTYGSKGLIQQFPSITTGGGTYALIKPDMTETYNVVQVYPG